MCDLFIVAENKKEKDLGNKKIHSEFFKREEVRRYPHKKWLIKGNKGGECMRDSAYR